MSVKIKADIRHWLRELDKKYFCVMLGFAVMVYFPLISQRLVNTFDGLWNGTWFIGGFWELSIGRWLWCVADAVRFGVQTEPLNALLTLSMMVLGITLLRRLFVERDSALTYFAGMAAISGAAVGVQLSYRYMSPIFGLSFLFAVLAAYWVITTTHAGAAVGCGAVILALSLGLYQANLAQPEQAVGIRVPCGEEQRRDIRFCPQRPEQRKSIPIRQVDIQDHQLRLFRRKAGAGSGAALGSSDMAISCAPQLLT